jgi:hypothetical protein
MLGLADFGGDHRRILERSLNSSREGVIVMTDIVQGVLFGIEEIDDGTLHGIEEIDDGTLHA